jgi:hypothetical protein
MERVKPSDIGVRIRDQHSLSPTLEVINAVAIFGLLLAKLITKLCYKLFPWFMPTPISEAVILDDWHKEELADWDRKFFRKTGRSVKKILNPPPPKPEDYPPCACSRCVKKAKLGGPK